MKSVINSSNSVIVPFRQDKAALNVIFRILYKLAYKLRYLGRFLQHFFKFNSYAGQKDLVSTKHKTYFSYALDFRAFSYQKSSLKNQEF